MSHSSKLAYHFSAKDNTHSPVHFLCDVIEIEIPDSGEDDADGEEEQSRYRNAAVVALFGLAELACAVIGIQLMLRSAHRDEGEHDVAEHKPDADERALAADVEHAGEQRHQDACDEEGVGQDLQIDRRAVDQKAL